MKFDEFDQYSEDLLMAQYDVAEIISHELMKGEVREDFLISTLQTCSDPAPRFVKGTLSDGAHDAGQLDIILCRPNSQLRRLGSQCFVSKDDALCVIEVKGNCTGRDLRKSSEKATLIRNLRGDNQPLFGVICYKMDLELKTVMKRFGYSFDHANQTWFDNATLPHETEANWRTVEYSELDFFVCLEEGKKVFLQKYEYGSGNLRFFRRVQAPLIKNLFELMRGLLVSANPQAIVSH